MPGARGGHSHPSNRLRTRDTGDKEHPPRPYSPGPNGAAQGDTSAQGRCSNSALHAGGLPFVPDPCVLPGMSSRLGVCHASNTTAVPTRLLLCSSAPGGGQMGSPPSSSIFAASLRYLLRSPRHRTPAALGLQPRHGPAALLVAPGTGASPAGSGRSGAGSAFPGARLPSPPSCPQPGLCSHRGTFPRVSGHRRGRGRERREEAGTLLGTGDPPGAAPRGCPRRAALPGTVCQRQNPALTRGQVLPGAEQSARSSQPGLQEGAEQAGGAVLLQG